VPCVPAEIERTPFICGGAAYSSFVASGSTPEVSLCTPALWYVIGHPAGKVQTAGVLVYPLQATWLTVGTHAYSALLAVLVVDLKN
jgi:hypothetical protein